MRLPTAISALVARLALGCTRREDGQTLAELGLILAFVTTVAIVAVGAIGLAISGQLEWIAGALGAGS